MSSTIQAGIIRAADLISNHHWAAVNMGAPTLVGATNAALPAIGAAYEVRAYVREAMAPGEYRADGLRTNPTADELIAAMTPEQAARALKAVAEDCAA